MKYSELSEEGTDLTSLQWRILYRKPGYTGWNYGWVALNSKVGIARLMQRFNRRDKGKAEWKADLVLPTDIDYH